MTPFLEDERIDCNAWQAIIDRLIGAGVDGLFATGPEGEFYSLDMEERTVALRFCRQAIAERVPLYGNVGCVTTRDTIKLAQQAEAVGVDVMVVATPYYIRPSARELVEHYVEVCRAVRLPVLAYNFPLQGGAELAADTVAQIAAKCGNLAGLIDPDGKPGVPGRGLAVFVGDDHLILPALERGCAGAVTASANVAPRLFVDLYRAFREGKRPEAERLQALANELAETIGPHTFPAVLKEAMGMAGLPAGPCRKPLGPVTAEARERLARVLAKLTEEGYLRAAAPAATA